MANYTPNYNLGKPEPTDPFGYNSFLPLFNDNMDKIDQIGGGGGGDNANQNIAENYDDTLTYTIGDYVIYDGLLYKCIADVSTAETFDPTKWMHVVVTDEMGSGGGGGGSTYVTLFDNQTTASPSTITLSDALTNYDQIQFQLRPTGSDAIFSMIYDVKDLAVGDTIGAGSVTNLFVWYYYTDATTLTLRTSTSNVYMSKIVGIKHGTGGGGSSYTSEILYSNPSSSVPATISLSKGMSNYDAIAFSGYRQQYPTYWASSMYLSDDIKTGRIITCGDDAMYAWYTVTDDTTLTSAGANLIIDKVYGLKFGGGSSSGVADVEVNGESVVDPDTKIASITSYFAVVNGELCQIYDDGN